MQQSRRFILRNRRNAFTLVELLVVISIAAVVSGLTLSGYRSVSDGNQRVSCQTNLTQIYQSLQLYSKDYDGFFPRFDPAGSPDNVKGVGLWALYSTLSNNSPDQISNLTEQFPNLADPPNLLPVDKPFALYIKNRKLLHCPADVENEDFTFPSPADPTVINRAYLSYQTKDPTSGEYTYQPWHGITDPNDWRAKRQLLRYRTPPIQAGRVELRRMPIADDAVITYCPWHRGSRPIDNVLFYSGAVRPVPQDQPNPSPQAGEPTTLSGWLRKPPF